MSTEPGSGLLAGIVGSPVAHSMSPVLHSAGYRALGLNGWRYERLECDADGFAGLLAGLDAGWRGLSVTMPAKRAALAAADVVTDRAAAVGAANTVTRLADGSWCADCTDVQGVRGALLAAAGFDPADGHPGPGVLLGAGGTAAAALAAFAELGLRHAVLVVRDPARAADTVHAAERVGVAVTVRRWSDVDFAGLAEQARVLVCTVPSAAIESVLPALTAARCVLDVIYHPWPTPLAESLQHKGKPVANGLDMLLHQAFDQFEQHTGHPAPRAAMRDALRAEVGNAVPLPLLED